MSRVNKCSLFGAIKQGFYSVVNICYEPSRKTLPVLVEAHIDLEKTEPFIVDNAVERKHQDAKR